MAPATAVFIMFALIDTCKTGTFDSFRAKGFGVSAALLQYNFRLNVFVFVFSLKQEQEYASVASGVIHAAH